MSGRPQRRTEVAVAVNTRRRHQGGEAIEQLERGEDQRATGAGAGLSVRFGVRVTLVTANTAPSQLASRLT
jgi:hypothetical protein